MGGELRPRPDLRNAKGGVSRAAGATENVLMAADRSRAYPVVDGIPILLAPEVLSASGPDDTFDLTDAKYAEAYEEMEFYNATAMETLAMVESDGVETVLLREMAANEEERRSFPHPRQIWIDSVHDAAAQMDAYLHLGPAEGKRMLQLGGSGTHAIKFAIAGAAETWLITPMLGEARIARRLASSAGVGTRFHCAVGIGEEIPLASGAFDGIYAGGCLHHTVTDIALPEAARVLKEGGRFAAVEPWRAPLYAFGTAVLGKREDAYCKPMTDERLAPIGPAFRSARTIKHGSLLRYPLIAFEKFGVPMARSFTWHSGRLDDAVSSLIPGGRRLGSSVAILAEK